MRLIKQPSYLQSEPPHPSGVVIWLHGLGASHTDLFEGLWQAVSPVCQQQYRAIFLQAPDRPISINGGMLMPAWYDIYGLSDEAPTDSVGLYQSIETVQQVIATQAADPAVSGRIVIAGFSQGGALALHAGLRAPHPIHQIHVFSGYVPMKASLVEGLAPANRSCPVSFYHGTADDVVPESFMQQGASYLATKGVSTQINSYERVGHGVPSDALATLEERVLNNSF